MGFKNELRSGKKKQTKSKKIVNPFPELKNFVRKPKTRKIFGLTLLLFAIYLCVAFTSFLFTWKKDQDRLSSGLIDLINSPEQAENWLGNLGAIISHQFIHDWFGVASFGFILILFLLAIKILIKIEILPLKRTFKHTTFGILWMCVFFGFAFRNPELDLLYLGGGMGYLLNQWLIGFVGVFGTGALIVFSLMVFLIWSFDLSFEKISNWVKDLGQEKIMDETAVDGVSEQTSAPINLLNEDIPEDEISPKNNESPELDLEETIENNSEDSAVIMDPVATESLSEDDEDSSELEISVEENSGENEILSTSEVNQKVKEFGEYDPTLDLASFKLPKVELLKDYGDGSVKVDREELEANKNKIVETLGNYNIQISKIKATIGPTVTLYEIVPAPGIRISKIKNLEDDIALSLAALGIRIIAPIPGRGTIGIEVPNQVPDIVSMRTVISSEKFQNSKMALPIALGKTISNETFVTDLTKMPHLLMAGATGQGKSVGLNAVLVSILYKKHPSQVKFVLVDPKKVELTLFKKIERHYLAKLPDEEDAIITDIRKVVNTLNSLCIEMDDRYKLLQDAEVRNLKEYNKKFVDRNLNPENGHRFLPYIVVVIDEFADLIMTAGKEIEAPIARLAQLARAIGIHLIIATQRPSVNIITGTIKANFPTRIAFRVTSKIDSRTILDTGGADQLIGRGDMLLSTGNEMVRLQCAFVDTPEVADIVEYIGNQRGYPDALLLPEFLDESAQSNLDLSDEDRDVMFEDAARVVVLNQQGSASLLQRKLKLGYNRAGRIIDQLEAAGIVGPFEGSKARIVLIQDEYALEQFLKQDSPT